MKATTICNQTRSAESFYNSLVLSAADERANSHIGGFSAQCQKHILPRRTKHTPLGGKWFDKTLCRYFSHHPVLGTALFVVGAPLGILLALTCLLTLLMYPVELFMGLL